MKLINPLLILRILSIILLIEAVSFLLCLPVAYIYNEPAFPFTLSSGISILLFFMFFIVSGKAKQEKLTNRDGFLSVTLSWIIFSLIGALPYIFSGTIPSFVNAFFESSSGFTTTGSSIFTDVENLPFSILFWRSLTHWIGGLGIIVLVIIILPSLKITGYQLFSLESSLKEKIHPKTKSIGYRVLFIYLGLTLAETILLNLGDMTFFDSICNSFSTIATGGFSTKNRSMEFYSSYNQYVVMIFMFLAGTSQVVFYYLFKFNFKKIIQNEEFWFYSGVTITVGAVMALILIFQAPLTHEEAFRHGFFNTISILTTTGFFSADYIIWPLPAIMILFLLLFTGASTGSTTGGIKMARHLIVLKNIKSIFTKLNHPNALTSVWFNGKILPDKTNITILSFIILYMFFFLIGTTIMVATGSDIVSSTSAVAASIGNIGPGFGTVGPTDNYAHFNDLQKVVLSLLMIIGRLEIVTVFVLFTRSFWKL